MKIKAYCADCGVLLRARPPGKSKCCRKCAAVRRWNDPAYRQKTISAMREKWKDESFRERHSEGLRRAWNNLENRERWRESHKKPREEKRCLDCDKIIDRQSTRCSHHAAKYLWKQPWYREKVVAAWYQSRYGKPYQHNDTKQM